MIELCRIYTPCDISALSKTIEGMMTTHGSGLLMQPSDCGNFTRILKPEDKDTVYSKQDCRPLGLDEIVEPGDYVAEVVGESLAMGTPGAWNPARHSVGRTPRDLQCYACRPLKSAEMAGDA